VCESSLVVVHLSQFYCNTRWDSSVFRVYQSPWCNDSIKTDASYICICRETVCHLPDSRTGR